MQKKLRSFHILKGMSLTMCFFMILTILFGLVSCSKNTPSNNDTGISGKSNDKSITAFSFMNVNNTALSSDVASTINGATISAVVPFGTIVTSLVPTLTLIGASVNPANGIAQDFSNTVTYTATAEDGMTQDYYIMVTASPCTVPLQQMGGTKQGCALNLNKVVTTPWGPSESWSSATGDIDGTDNVSRFNFPRGITSDGANLYIADSGNNKIRKIDLATGVVTTLAGPSQGTIVSGDTDGSGSSARFQNPWSITTDGTNLYVAETANQKIRQIVIATGVVTTLAGPAQGSTVFGDTNGTAGAARFLYPSGITTDGTNLYVSDSGNNKIRKINIATRVVTTLAGPAQGTIAIGDIDGIGNVARFRSPAGITTDGINLYVADNNNNKIRKIVIVTGEVTTLAGPASGSTASGDTDGIGNAARFQNPAGITTDGTNLYVSDKNNNKIRRIVISTGAVTTLAGPAQGMTNLGGFDGTGNNARFNKPGDIVSNGSNLYIVDSNNSKIRKIE